MGPGISPYPKAEEIVTAVEPRSGFILANPDVFRWEESSFNVIDHALEAARGRGRGRIVQSLWGRG